jgi:cytochrome P450
LIKALLSFQSDFYRVAQGVSRGVAVPNIFSTTDKAYHAKVRRSVANAFAMSTLVQYEPFVAETVATFLRVLDERFAVTAGPGEIFDITDWNKYFALDVVSMLTMGEPYGLLEAGYDHVGIIKARTGLLRYFTIVNNVPWLDKVFKKNPIIMWLGRRGLFNSVTLTVPIAQRQIAQKSRDFKPLDESMKSGRARVDLLTKFLQAKVNNPEIIDDRAVLGLTLSIVNAGSGTVSTTLSAIIYFLLQNPPVLDQLVEEVDSNFPQPASKVSPVNFADYVVPFSEAQKLSFLDAVIKEIYRIWPGLGAQHIERLTPPEGAYIMGEFIPGNIIVTCVAWIMHRHKPTYGEDAEEFRPSRWLEADHEQLTAMNKALLTFGAGPNTCIGKNIALLELYTVIPALVRAFKVGIHSEVIEVNAADNCPV